MNFSIFSLLVAFLPFIHCDWYHNVKSVQIQQNNVWDYIGSDKHIILDFFTPWCRYCQQMSNQWNQVFEHYTSNKVLNEHIVIAKVNCAEESQVCSIFNVQSFPSIMHFQPNNKNAVDRFTSQRSFENFQSWIDQICQVDQYKDEVDYLLNKKEIKNIEVEEETTDHDEEIHDFQVEIEVILDQIIEPYDVNEKWVYDDDEEIMSIEQKERLVQEIDKLSERISTNLEQLIQKQEEYKKKIKQLDNHLEYVVKITRINSLQVNFIYILIPFILLLGITIVFRKYLKQPVL